MSADIFASQANDFDFDEMLRLAIDSPLEFDRKRENLIQSALDGFRQKDNGWRLQSEIDAICASAGLEGGCHTLFANRLRSITETFEMALNDLRII